MHYAISSQFGFVSTLSAKVRENEKALDYAQKLLTELQQIDPEACYEWANWASPVDFARKISGFIYWFKETLGRLRFIIDNMRLSLFRLRRDEKQASLLRNMARYLRKHPEFDISDTLFDDPSLIKPLKIAPPMKLKTYIDAQNSHVEIPLIQLVQSLRKQAVLGVERERETSVVDNSPIENIVAEHDYFEDQVEQLFEQVIISGEKVSAITYWQQSVPIWGEADHTIAPNAWIELVFSYYCKLTNEQQDALDIEMEGELVKGTSANYNYRDVHILLKN